MNELDMPFKKKLQWSKFIFHEENVKRGNSVEIGEISTFSTSNNNTCIFV
jgi:hypothetical protein